MIADTDFTASTDDDVGSTKEVGDGSSMGVEETLLRFWHALSAPVDLHKFVELTLYEW